MTDITWAAIIGVAGTLLGSLAGGLISYCIAKKQSEIRLKELHKQIEHQERESRRDRLIEIRKPYLLPLRETVSKWVIELTHLVDQINVFGESLKSHEQYPFLYQKPEPQEEKLKEIENKMKDLEEQIEFWQGQISDSELNDFIVGVLFQEAMISINSWPIIYSTLEERKSGKKDVKLIEEALDKIKVTSFKLQSSLQRVSNRIEELLIGDEGKSLK